MTKKEISVIGAGTMGCGIAQIAAQNGFKVVMYDGVKGKAEKGLKAIGNNLEKETARGELAKETASRIMDRISPARRLRETANSFFIIEAISENREEKGKLFKELDALCGERAILASNTSSIPITDIASKTWHPERVIGMHFMNPVPLMQGVEIIRGLKTSDKTFQVTKRLAERLTKQPVYSSDKAGFVINRMLMPMINEAVAIVEEGTSTIEDVDKGAIHCLNHPMGPLALSDLIGNDITHHILSALHNELGQRFKPAPLLTRLVESGLCGAKSGAGFYIWKSGRPQAVNDVVRRYLKSE